MTGSASSGVEFGGVTPILRVAVFATSVAFYVDALGFSIDWQEEGFACVRRGRVPLMLCSGDQGPPGTWVYIGVSDVDALYVELQRKQVPVRHPPTNYPWG